MPAGSHGTDPPAFFLAEDSDPAEPELRSEDAQHALRVLRMAAGDLLVGLDGRGMRLPLRVRAARKGTLELEPAGTQERVPAPGEEGSALSWFEVAVAWPRRNRVEGMIGRLVQLGAAAIRPLEARQRGPQELPEGASERLLRVAREACKQCGRAWLPVFEPALAPAELARTRPGAALAFLDPGTGQSLDVWLRSLRPSPLGLGTRARPIVLAIGPEGGWTDEEREALRDLGASATWLAPYTLRIETAAEATMAIAAHLHGRSFSDRRD